MMRILITGFGPFPGQPTNPTMRLARHAGRAKPLRYAGIERSVRLLPTTWGMLDGVPAMLADIKPDAVLMFGVAGRRRKVTPEVRAMNHQSALKPDAAGGFAAERSRVAGAPFALRAPFAARRLQVVIQRAGAPCGLSQNAGGYLCNALSWQVLASGVPAIFVHVPRPRRMLRRKGHEKRPRPTMRQLEAAAEAALAFVARASRS